MKLKSLMLILTLRVLFFMYESAHLSISERIMILYIVVNMLIWSILLIYRSRKKTKEHDLIVLLLPFYNVLPAFKAVYYFDCIDITYNVFTNVLKILFFFEMIFIVVLLILSIQKKQPRQET